MNGIITQAELARLADVSKVAVHKAVKRGSVRLTAGGQVDLSDETNLMYLHHRLDRKAVDQGWVNKRIAPGWAALVAITGQEVVPLFFFQPHPLSDDDGVDLSQGWSIDTEGDEWTAIDPQGGEYPAVLIYDQESPPPWMELEE